MAGYHAPIGRSVTDFTVAQRRTGALFFCGAECRLLALRVASAVCNSVATGVKADNRADMLDPTLLTLNGL
jgi:hypothetical protein